MFEVNHMKLNEQITFLRKQKGMTQEELAKTLGVTNQAVSKWEVGQCCPDISLLPDLAALFEVSVDALLGRVPTATPQDLMLALREKIELLSQEDGYAFAYRVAAGLHAMLVSKEIVKNNIRNGWDTEDVIAHAGEGEWGYTCLDVTAYATTMRKGAVFFSSNRHLQLMNGDMRRISMLLKPFSDVKTLKIAYALYELTYRSEDRYATIDEIEKETDIAAVTIEQCLNDTLSAFVVEKKNGFRFDGMYTILIPLLSLFDQR